MSVATAAKYIGVSRSHLYRLIRVGAINVGRLGHRTIIRRADADRLLENALKPTLPNLAFVGSGGVKDGPARSGKGEGVFG
ncbi:helix-turn-helix domain-containing protein [Agrobacterium deltaense]|uniref:helix-turn-helix domain-containing protein n=1 Tax=Agrobacterium deltaense TaxID=1183412 RepID=UPI001CB7ABA4